MKNEERIVNSVSHELVGGVGLCVNRIVPEGVAPDAEVALVFLHEALGSIGQWKSFPAELCGRLGLRGIVYDRQGHGGSAPLGPGNPVAFKVKSNFQFWQSEAEAVLRLKSK